MRHRFPFFLLLCVASLPSDGENLLRTRKYHPGSKQEAFRWQQSLRRDLFGILKLEERLDKKDSIDLRPERISTEQRDGYTFHEFEISSTPARRISVVLTLPATGVTGPFPAVVCIHGHGGNRDSVYDKDSIYKGFAETLAKKGVVTVSADVGQHEVYEEGMILMGERLWDLIRCVDFLESRPEVDKERIGCAGLSLGGEMAMWLGAMDTRVRATVSAGFLTTMDQMEVNHCLCWKFPGLRELVDYADIYSLVAPRALMCQNGLREGKTQFYVPLARKALQEIEPIYNDYGVPENLELDVHPGGHEVDLPALLRFFEKHLSVSLQP